MVGMAGETTSECMPERADAFGQSIVDINKGVAFVGETGWVIFDAIALIVLISAVTVCARRGFVSSVLSAVLGVISVVLAVILSGPLAVFVYGAFLRGVIISSIENAVTEQLEAGLIGAAGWLETLPSWAAALVPGGVNLPQIGSVLDVGPVVEELVDIAIADPIIMILRVLFMFVLFLIFWMIGRRVAFFFRRVDSIPLVGRLDTLLGGVLGVFWAAIILSWFAVCAVFYLAFSGGGGELINAQNLSGGFIFSFFFRLFR